MKYTKDRYKLPKYYTQVLEDLKKENSIKCKKWSMGCFNCAVWQMISSLETYIDLMDYDKDDDIM